MRGVCFPSGSQSKVVWLPYSAALQVLFKRLMMQGSPEVEDLPLWVPPACYCNSQHPRNSRAMFFVCAFVNTPFLSANTGKCPGVSGKGCTQLAWSFSKPGLTGFWHSRVALTGSQRYCFWLWPLTVAAVSRGRKVVSAQGSNRSLKQSCSEYGSFRSLS